MSRGTPLQITGLIEEIQDYIAANSGLGYVVGENFTAEDYLDIDDLARLAGSKILMTIFSEGGQLIPSGRRAHMQFNYRFVAKGTHANAALDRARELVEWLWDTHTFETSTFRVWIAQFSKLPGIIGRGDSNSFLADFVATILAFKKTG